MSGAVLTVVLTLTALALALVALERGPNGTRELALVAALGAVAAAGRVLTAGIPSVQPVTVTCLVAGAALGVRAGLAVGPVAALVSNGFLGHGPWTPGQMGLWALVGLSGALLGPALRRPWVMAAAGAAWGVLFGWGMNLWELATFGPEVSWAAFLAGGGRSLPFEIAGAVGNVVFALAAGPALLRLLARYRVRSRVELLEPSVPSASPGPSVSASIDSTRARSSR
ncbi:MAG: ECF transporter S component [Thermoleophilia bacterium]|nr:ECF transporter S component [Thermoleophilia bacterium]